MRAGLFGGTIVVLAIVVIVLVSLLGGGSSAPSGAPKPIKPFKDPAIAKAVTHVPVSELDAAGSSGFSAISNKTPTDLITLKGPKLTKDGKPEVIFFGAEYCPYCAFTRWPLTIALSRFGTFTGLELTGSTPFDIFENTHTLTYLKAHYTSKYITLSTTEEESNECPQKDIVSNPEYSQEQAAGDDVTRYACEADYPALQRPSKAVLALFDKIDTTKNFGSSDGEGNGGGIPFIDIGGRYAEDGALDDPGILHLLTWKQIVDSFKVPKAAGSPGQAILELANRYTAMICNVTGQKPGSVCKTKTVMTAEKGLK